MGNQAQDRVVVRSGRGLAWAAFLFSALAFAMSGYVFFQTQEVLVRNTETILGDLRDVFDKSTENIKQRRAEGPRWDLRKLREKIEGAEARLRTGDSRAGYYIDVLLTDLENMREFTSDRGGETISKTIEELRSARDWIAEDSTEAADRLRRLSKDLADKARAAERFDR